MCEMTKARKLSSSGQKYPGTKHRQASHIDSKLISKRGNNVVEEQGEARPYLNRICSIGSYLCILYHLGDRNLSLVEESWPCDHSVSNGLMIPVIITAVEDRSPVRFWLGMIMWLSDRLYLFCFFSFPSPSSIKDPENTRAN